MSRRRRRAHRAPHQVVEYAPVRAELRRLPSGGSVLEVGSGPEGLATFWHRPVVGTDLVFDHRPAPTLRPVIADATRLPFHDGSFDLVVSVSLLSVIEGSLEEACAEMARVCRGRLLVVTPCGEEAERSDRRSLDWCRAAGVDPPEWLLEQVADGMPSIDRIRAALSPHGELTQSVTLSTKWSERFFRLWQRMRRVPGLMTAIQPVLRVWQRIGARALPGRGPAYELGFLVAVASVVSDSLPL